MKKNELFEKAQQNFVVYSEELKDIIMNHMVGTEDSFFPEEEGIDLIEFQNTKTAKILALSNRINLSLQCFGVQLTIDGLWHQKGEDLVFKYRPRFFVKYRDYEFNFDYGPFFNRYTVTDKDRDLMILYPRMEVSAFLNEAILSELRDVAVVSIRQILSCFNAEDRYQFEERILEREQVISNLKDTMMGKSTVQKAVKSGRYV